MPGFRSLFRIPSGSAMMMFLTVSALLITHLPRTSVSQPDPGQITRFAVAIDNPGDITSLLSLVDTERLVLMGEASHGTSEFYQLRALLSMELVAESDFRFIAVEGDWPAFARINAFVKQKPGAPETLDEAMDSLTRWPLWMWRNHEFRELVEWLYQHNAVLAPEQRAGLYGIDVYDHERTMQDVADWVASVDRSLGRTVSRAYSCVSRYNSIGDYIRMVAQTGEHCGPEMERALAAVRSLEDHPDVTEWDFFRAEHGALAAQNAELHYRANLEQSGASWNYRASHFYLTAERLLERYGENSRGIVWAHNTHIGDARATDMAQFGILNIGQLSRMNLGNDAVFAIGFGTFSGEVLAAASWEGTMQVMPVPPASAGSLEYLLMQVGPKDFWLDLNDREVASLFTRRLPHRAIGVTYNPANEQNNFVPTNLAERYNAFVFLGETSVLDPLD